MKMYVEPTNAEVVPCPYLDGKKFQQRYCVLKDLKCSEFDFMLKNGWRHFGYFFFMSNCNDCNSCTPIRTLINSFKLSKSQRRNLRKNSDVDVEFVKPIYSDEIYNVYKKHSMVKFNQKTTVKDFKESFFADAIRGNSKLSLFRINGKLVGVGFIDISEEAINSVYFCYDTDFSSRGLGVFSVLSEIEYGLTLNKSYYYLGYYIDGNRSMEYKSKYTPSEIFLWNKSEWISFK